MYEVEKMFNIGIQQGWIHLSDHQSDIQYASKTQLAKEVQTLKSQQTKRRQLI